MYILPIVIIGMESMVTAGLLSLLEVVGYACVFDIQHVVLVIAVILLPVQLSVKGRVVLPVIGVCVCI